MRDVQELIEWITKIGAYGTAILIIFSLSRGWLLLPREATELRKQLADAKSERDEWRKLALRGTSLAKFAAKVAQAQEPAKPPSILSDIEELDDQGQP